MDSLQATAANRRARLEASLQLQQFYASAEEEESWMKEKEQLATMADTGHDLIGTQYLMKKLEVR